MLEAINKAECNTKMQYRGWKKTSHALAFFFFSSRCHMQLVAIFAGLEHAFHHLLNI